MPLAEDTSISRVLINLVFGRIYFDGGVGFYVCIFTGRSNAAHKEPSSFRVVVFCRGVLVVDGDVCQCDGGCLTVAYGLITEVHADKHLVERNDKEKTN